MVGVCLMLMNWVCVFFVYEVSVIWLMLEFFWYYFLFVGKFGEEFCLNYKLVKIW